MLFQHQVEMVSFFVAYLMIVYPKTLNKIATTNNTYSKTLRYFKPYHERMAFPKDEYSVTDNAYIRFTNGFEVSYQHIPSHLTFDL